MDFELPSLNYYFNSLEPHIDKETMEIHHGKHHQAYVTNLNKAIAGTKYADKDLEYLVKNAGNISSAVRNNAGGHYNHSFFWRILSPHGGGNPGTRLLDIINSSFGSLESFKEQVNQAALARFGSGWAWVVQQDSKLIICSTPNQDNPLMDVADVKGSPILGIDVWEHAYYLKYQNKRIEYLNAIWNVINWEVVESKLK